MTRKGSVALDRDTAALHAVVKDQHPKTSRGRRRRGCGRTSIRPGDLRKRQDRLCVGQAGVLTSLNRECLFHILSWTLNQKSSKKGNAHAITTSRPCWLAARG